MSIIIEAKALAEQHHFKFEVISSKGGPSQTHCRVTNSHERYPIRVDWWPFSKRGTAYHVESGKSYYDVDPIKLMSIASGLLQ